MQLMENWSPPSKQELVFFWVRLDIGRLFSFANKEALGCFSSLSKIICSLLTLSPKIVPDNYNN